MNPPNTQPLSQRKDANPFPGYISTSVYTVLKPSTLLFSPHSELLCKATECCETAFAIPQVGKSDHLRMTNAGRNGVHESTDPQIKLRSLQGRTNQNLLDNTLSVFAMNNAKEHVWVFISKSQHSPTPSHFQLEAGEEETWL